MMPPPVTPTETTSIVPSATPGETIEEESTEPKDKTASATQSEVVVPPTSYASQVPKEKTPEQTIPITGGAADSPSKVFESLTSPLFESFITGMSEETAVEKIKSGIALDQLLLCLRQV